ALIRLSRLDEAIAQLSMALEKATGSASANVIQRAAVLQSLGWAFQEANAADRAFSLFLAGLDALESVPVPAKDHRARLYNSIGIHYYDLHNADSAIVYYSKAAQLRKDLYGENHPLYATPLANLALAHHLGGDRSLTVPYYAKATEIYASH